MWGGGGVVGAVCDTMCGLVLDRPVVFQCMLRGLVGLYLIFSHHHLLSYTTHNNIYTTKRHKRNDALI